MAGKITEKRHRNSLRNSCKFLEQYSKYLELILGDSITKTPLGIGRSARVTTGKISEKLELVEKSLKEIQEKHLLNSWLGIPNSNSLQGEGK